MLTAIRAFAKTWVAAVLIGLLVVSFAVFGIRDVFRGKTVGDWVIKAGDRSVSAADYKREFDNYKTRLEQQAGQPISMDLAVQNGLDRQVLQGLAGREAFSELLRKTGIEPSDKLIAAELGKIPAFFDRVSGRFDKTTYTQKLAENGLTPARFDQVMRDQIAQEQWARATANGLQVPRAYSALAAIYALEGRDIAYFRVGPASVPQPPPPTDAQLASFMTENAAQLMRPEFRILSVVRFSPDAVGANLPVDEAAVKKRYDFRKDTLSSPETRTVVQIPARSAPAAQQIGAALAAGKDPNAVAKAAGVDAITYADKPQSAIADRKVAKAAFAMKAGDVSAVQGDLGVAIVQVVSVKPGHAVSFEEARPQLEAELRHDAAAEKVYALTQTYDDAHQGGATLAEAAQKAGVPVMTIGPVTKSGQDQQARPVPGLSPKLLETAFSTPAGGESEVEDAGGGDYFAVRVEKILPPALPPLAEVRPQLARVWMTRALAKELQGRADALAERVRKGESLDAVAASAGSAVMRAPGLTRQAAQQNTELSRDLLSKTFGVGAGEVFVAEDTQFGLLVARLEALHAGVSPQMAQIAEQARPQISLTLFREMDETAHRAARVKMKVVVNLDRARAALGIAPDGPAAGVPAGPAK
jgi:peptidyl-prolyl cis-trans isomerase D